MQRGDIFFTMQFKSRAGQYTNFKDRYGITNYHGIW